MEWHEGFRKQIEYCTYCPKLCRFSCPVAEAESMETFTPTAKATVMKLIMDGVMPLDRDAADVLYACNACRITQTYCEHDIDAYPPMEAARSQAVLKGVAPDSVGNYWEKWSKRKNPFDEDLSAAIKEHAPAERIGNSAPVVLFTGCVGPHYFPDSVSDAAKVLDAMGADYTVYAKEEMCCGYPALTLGYKEGFIKQAKKIAEDLSGAELVISPCPSCVHFLKDRYPEFGIEISAEIKHITQFIFENLDKLDISEKDDRKVIYHDPCYLGRYLGVYEEPRKILESAFEKAPLEFFENHDAAPCCGGGGGVPVTRPETARKISGKKVLAAKESGAGLIATACPTCRRMLGRSGKDLGIECEDITAILAKCIS